MTATAYAPDAHPRRWLPEDVELKTWEQIEPWYRRLLDRPIDSPEELESWLFDVGELNAAVGQEGVERYIAMTCQTDDPEREAAHLAFVRDIEPKLKPLQNAIREQYLDSPHRAGLPRDRYHVFDRAQENRRALYREANIPRETELAELEQQYQKIIGAMTVDVPGAGADARRRWPRSSKRPTARSRQAAWELVAARRLADQDTLDDLFDRMIELRVEIAREAGFDNFVDYAFRLPRAVRLRRRGDGPVPGGDRARRGPAGASAPGGAPRRRSGSRRSGPGTWRSTRSGRPPLRPFTRRRASWPRGPRRSSRASTPSSGGSSPTSATHGLLDLANRKGKAPGGYQTTLEDDRLPFIFMNAVGLDGDVRTLLHEGGHAFHALASRGEPLAAYRESPIEFCEVASMSMELLGARNLERFYDADDADRSYRQLLEGIVLILPWIATVDAFQHWIYTHPGHTRDERRRGLDGAARPVRRDRRLVGLRGRPGALLAPPAAHLPLPVLLHRVRDRAARRLADLAAIARPIAPGRSRPIARPWPWAAPARCPSSSRRPGSASSSARRPSAR